MAWIRGTAAPDVIDGTGTEDDVVFGQAGDDRLGGGEGDDVLWGRTGDDVLRGGPGADRLIGGAGFDIASYYAETIGWEVDLGAAQARPRSGGQRECLYGIEAVSGGTDDDRIVGGGGSERLSGFAGDDHLAGRGGRDTLRGGEGDDRLDGGSGNDTLDGGAGSDAASYAGASRAVQVDLALVGPQDTKGAGTDRFVSVEHLAGSRFGDRLEGDAAANRIEGGAGNDVLEGKGGDDELFGGAGADLLDGGAGVDRLDGGAGRDRVDYSAVDQTSALFFQREPFRFPEFGAGVRVELVAFATSYATDAVIGVEDVTGSRFADVVFGSAAANRIDGGSGDDRLLGDAGADRLLGGAGDDQLEGGDGRDTLLGGAGDDVLLGGAGDDVAVFVEGIGSVSVSFNETPRTIYTDDRGGWGEGLAFPTGLIEIDTGAGIDLVAGVETFVFGGERFSLTALARAQGDLVLGDASAQRLGAAGRASTVVAMEGDDQVQGGSVDSTLSGGAGDDRLDGQGGDDRLFGDKGDDLLLGGSGGDALQGGEGSDVVDGGAGDDQLDGGTGPTEPYRGFDQAEDAVRYATAKQGVVVSMSVGDAAQDTIGAGIDRLAGFERLVGSGHDDRLTGFDRQIGEFDLGKPSVEGGAGADVIVSGTASERLDGGLGADTYVWTAIETTEIFEPEQVAFEPAGDRLDLTAFDLDASDVTLERSFEPGAYLLGFEGFVVELRIADAAYAEDVAGLRTVLDGGALLL